jgi:excisionase family DNA binding protein
MNLREDGLPQLMKLGELAEYLRFPRHTIYKLLRQGGIPFLKVGSEYRFDRDEIDKWTAQQQINR